MTSPIDQLPANVRAALERGSAIEAIRLLRESQGVGLKEAKEMIDRHQSGVTVSISASAQQAALPPEVIAALQQGQKIEAIRLLRESTGLGLKDAKDAVESARIPEPLATRAPGAVAPSGGGMGWVAVVIAVAAVIYFALRWMG